MNKVISIIKYVIKGIRLAWVEFRFIIPRKLWKSYFKNTLFKFKYGNQNDCFYCINDSGEYNEWIKQSEKFNLEIGSNKKVCICIYTTNDFVNKDRLETSIKNQTYKNFEIQYNSSSGESDYILFVNSDDVLSPNCLNEIVRCESSLIYFDEDEMLDGLRVRPKFKPDYSPDTLLSKNYVGNSFAIKTVLCDINEFNNSSLYDLFIRVSEKEDIYHISKVLVHKYSSNDVINHKDIVINALARRGVSGTVSKLDEDVYIDYSNESEMVSILIPTRDGADILRVCLESIYNKTSYSNYEVIVIDNGSESVETFELFKEYANHSNFKVLRLDCEFNYSLLNNEAAKISNGEYVIFLNNDTEVITPDWIEKLLGYARQNHIGAVGAKLYFPDNTIQHNGVILGLFLVAGHCYWNFDKSYEDYNRLTKIVSNFSAVTAACLMVKKSKMLEIGGLNEKELKVGSNDVDFCIRLLNHGYYNVLNPQVELFHHESKSRGVDNKTFEKYNRCKDEIEYMLNTYSDLIVNDPFYNENYSLMRAYHLDKCDGEKMRQENIGIFTC